MSRVTDRDRAEDDTAAAKPGAPQSLPIENRSVAVDATDKQKVS